MSARKSDRLLFTVGKGMLTPSDQFTFKRLRDRGYHIGDVLSADLRKPRNPLFHRKAHALGQLCADNLDSFSGMAAHAVLKRLQMEANVCCEELAYILSGHMIVQRVPRSLSFADMDEGAFTEFYESICRHISDAYWGELEPYQVEEMAQFMEAA